ncbi:MAG TPA: flagellar biosynthesis anti-sigma factor FlgM [Chloroflexota bacterium]|jgi:negative regulator of flagellin synthesis FlgM|nr:flagellar biosynthesis anti-sigma factor FlgM [Chloroflexota bacterium]
MSISQISGNDRLRAAMAAQALRTTGAYAPTAAPTRQPDSVSLSDSARALSAAHKTVAAAPAVREDRVAALKAAIADGSYTIDSRQLARAMAQQLDIVG